MTTVVSRQGGNIIRTSDAYTPSGTKHPRAQRFQMMSSVPSLAASEDFNQTMGLFLNLRSHRDAVREKEAALRKQGIYSDEGIKRELSAFRKTLLPRVREVKETNAKRAAKLRERPAPPAAPVVSDEMLAIRERWWFKLTPDRRERAFATAVTGADPELAAVMHHAPWVFGVSEGTMGLLKKNLGLVVEDNPIADACLSAAQLLEEEAAEFEAEITADEPKPQAKRSEMSTHEKHSYLVQHGSAAFLALPE